MKGFKSCQRHDRLWLLFRKKKGLHFHIYPNSSVGAKRQKMATRYQTTFNPDCFNLHQPDAPCTTHYAHMLWFTLIYDGVSAWKKTCCMRFMWIAEYAKKNNIFGFAVYIRSTYTIRIEKIDVLLCLFRRIYAWNSIGIVRIWKI